MKTEIRPHLLNLAAIWLQLIGGLAVLASARAGVEISEFMAKNDTVLATSAGVFEDWIEIHNDTAAPVDLAGWYLSDDPADLTKWQFPSTAATSPLAAGGYLIVFADGSANALIGSEIHAGFKLGAGGEYLALVEPDGTTIAHQFSPEYPPQAADISYGIDAVTGSPAFFSTPSPAAQNTQITADAVQFSAASGTITSSFVLTLSVPSPTATIRYTLDGSVPTTSSTPYSSGITISSTTRVRARAFDTGLADGPVSSETYYRLAASAASFTSDLPLVVLDNFGAGAVPHPDDATRQVCGLMMFEPIGGVTRLTDSPTITSRAGLRRRGESSLRNTNSKPNLSIETWAEVDEETRSIEPLGFPAESDWILFAPWAFDRALMRNSFIYEVSNQAGRYAVRTRFVEVFLNHGGGSITDSDYYGVYVFMEKIKQDAQRVDVVGLPSTATAEPDITGGYLWKKDKADPGDQNFTVGGKTLTGVYPREMPNAQLNWLSNHLDQVDSAIPNGNYESLIDVASFADHHILNVFANNADGLNFSTYYHKDRNGLVQMGPIWDFDRSMGCDNDARASDPETWSLATDSRFFFHSNASLWFRSLALNDPDFWMTWVDRWQLMRDWPLSDAAMIERIEGYRGELSTAAIRNFDKWENIDASEWPGKVDTFKNHVLTRAQWIDDQLIDRPVFSHAGGMVSAGTQLSINGPETKYYTLDGSDPRAPGGSSAGTAYSVPISITQNTLIKARAGSGAPFTNAPNSWPWSPMSEALFIVDPAPLAVTEIMYHPRPPEGAEELAFATSDFEWVEIQNTSGAPCQLVGVQMLDGVDFDFTTSSDLTLAARAYGVIVSNLDAFKARYSNWASLNLLGEFDGSLSNGGEQIELGYPAIGIGPLAAFEYDDDWFPSTDGEGFSLVLNDPQAAPASWDNITAWRHSSAVDGSPGVADPALAHPQGSLVINEVLTHQDTDDPGDWIELHNTTGSDISIGGWFLSDSRGELKKYTIPAGMIVPANGFIVLTEHDHFGAAFALNEHGDSVYLSAGSGGALSEPAYREHQRFGAQERDVTFGRLLNSDATADFPAQVSATMGAANSGPRVGPVVIGEIHYHPALGGHEFVEVRNLSGDTVSLFDPANPANAWKVSGINFEFPAGVELVPGGTLLLVRNTIGASEFRTNYQVPASIEIYNYSGALDNDSDRIVLKKPGEPDAGSGFVPYIDVEEVAYRDRSPWPTMADGLGKALGRIDPQAYANDPTNWQPVTPSFGPVTFSLTVHAGTGGGAFAAGADVPIAAEPTGFVRWIGNVAGIANVDHPTTTLTMPAQDVAVTALYSEEMTLIAEDALWRYNDQGLNFGSVWRRVDFVDSGWEEGAARLGYGDDGETSVIGYGGDPDNKYITTYFRKNFAVPDASAVSDLSMELLRDDGAVVFLNGAEVARDNMPAGAIGFRTVASDSVGNPEEDTFFPFELSPGDLVDGNNVIAVEIHQRAADSSDLSFALRLKAMQAPAASRLDGDADGMPDVWEVEYFGSTEAGIPGIDSDGDGVSNLHESIAGTSPLDANSHFRIEALSAVGGGGFQITWIPVADRIYSVHWSPDLRTPFVLIASGLTSGSYTDSDHSAEDRGFYRIEVELD